MKSAWTWILLILILITGINAQPADLTFPAYLAARPSATTPLGVNDRLVVLQGGAVRLLPQSGLGIPSLLSELTGDATHRTVTDTEKSTWNGKQDNLGIRTVVCGGSDDTTAINAALSGGNVHVILSGSCATSTSLVMYLNTWLEVAPGSSVTQAASNTTTLLKNHAYDIASGRDSNIVVSGGTWTRNASAGSGQNLHAINFNYVDGLVIRDVNITTTGTNKYAIAASDVTNVVIDNINSPSSNSDVVHLIGPASNIKINNITGANAGDDIVGVTARDYATYAPGYGNITDLSISNITGTSSTSIVKVIGGTSATVRRVSIRNIFGVANVIVNLFEDTAGCGVSDVSEVVVDGVYARPLVMLVDGSTTAGGKLVLRNLYPYGAYAADPTFIQLWNWSSVLIDGFQASDIIAGRIVYPRSGYTVANLMIKNVTLPAFNTAMVVNIDGTVTRLAVDGLQMNITDTNTSNIFNFGANSSVDVTTFNNVEITNGKCLMNLVAGTNKKYVLANNIRLKGTNRLLNTGSPLDLTLTNFIGDTLINAAIYVSNTTTVDVRGSGINRIGTWNGFQRAGSEVINCYNIDYPADTALLATTTGAKCFSTTTAPLGPSIYTGSAWRSLYSLP